MRSVALATLTVFALPSMIHAEERGQLVQASAQTGFSYAAEVVRALGVLTKSERSAVMSSRAQVLPIGPSLSPEQLIKAGPTDIGDRIEALGSDSISIGLNTHANGNQSVAIGSNANTGNVESVAIGKSVISSGVGSTAIGVNAEATNGDRSLAIGNLARAGSTDSIVIGNNSIVGDTANTGTDKGISLGTNNVVSGAGSVALGNQATISGINSMVLGNDVSVSGANSVVLGSGSDGSQSNVVSIGAKGAERRIVNLAPGTLSATSTDAVNASQLHSVASSTAAAIGGGAALGADGALSAPSFTVNGGKYTDVGSAIQAAAKAGVDASADTVRFDGDERTSVTLGGTAGAQIHNLQAGKADMDAVNVKQLKDAGLTIDPSGIATNAFVAYDNIGKGKITLGGGTAGTILSNLAKGTDDSDAVNVKQLKDAGLTIDPSGIATNAFVAYDNIGKSKITLGGGTAGTILSNLAKGTDDSDAVNVKQLKDAGLTIDPSGIATNAFVAYDNIGKGKITLGGGTAGTILSNLAIGTDDSDAVNVKQLKDAGLTIDPSGIATNAFVAYDDIGKGRITLGGSDGTTIANVKAGVDDHDAVNVAQLKQSGLVDPTGNTLAAVVYDTNPDGTVNRAQVTLGGASASAPVALRNVAAGRIAAGSTDAVNGDQLFQTKQLVDGLQNGGSLKYFTTNSSLTAAQASGADSLAIGGNAQASGKNAVALGANSVADRADSVSVGAVGQERQITNVKAGTADTDAVNVSQLKSSGLIDSKGNTVAALTYDKTASGATDYANVTLGNGTSGGTTLHNVAAGSLITDAVNVGQLNDAVGKVNNFTAATMALFSADGNGATEAAVSSGTHSLALGANALASGVNAVSTGAGAIASADNSVALGANSVADRANSVSVGATGAERQITNVAAGTSGTDAVNLDQLNRASGSTLGQANSYTDQRFNNADQQIRDLDRNTRKGIAAASALNVVTPYLPGRTALNAGVAAYRGQAALGIGVSRWNEKGNLNFNAGVSSSGGNSTIVRAGIGYVFGG
ncbi:YadA-like family protein [Caballeronia telluris]|nr:YadA-like family protein [Caballeronia telluris]